MKYLVTVVEGYTVTREKEIEAASEEEAEDIVYAQRASDYDGEEGDWSDWPETDRDKICAIEHIKEVE